MTKNIVRENVVVRKLPRKELINLKVSDLKVVESPRNSKFSSFKQKCILLLIMFIMMIIMPLIAVRNSNGKDYSEIFETPKKFSNNSTVSVNSRQIPTSDDFFCFKDEAKNKILKLPDRDFMIGTLASEMPALFEKEALKAQSVAIYTYFCRLRNEFRKKNPDPESVMFTANTDDWIYFVADENMREKWGDKFSEYKAKMESAVDEVFGEVLKYNNELILAPYHAISSGITERAGEVFGGDELPYLVNVNCESDKNVPSYSSVVEVYPDEFESKMKDKYPKLKVASKKENWVHDISHTSGGSVKKIFICNICITGRELRSIFGLRSSNFDLNFDGEKFVFSVRGYGHGVGMSQYAAHDMAVNGANYKEILAKFYPGTELTKL